APLRRNIGEIVEIMNGYRSVAAHNAAEELRTLKEREQQLGLGESIEELDGIIDSIAEGSSRTAEIVRGLRNFSRLDEDDLNESDLNEGLRSTLAVLAPQYRDKVRIDVQWGDVPRVECYPGKVNQVFMNILTNAVQATLARTDDEPRLIRVTTSLLDDHVVVSIKDNGIGMSDAVKARMYDPFFTTKAVGEGTGLGLAIVYGIIEDHQGNITVDSEVGQGTEFRILLPLRHARLNERRA
ncbi:MAG TPA: ATP-binding protein, partial [Flavobacteriales bacterium]|nr:ATP-binding protein [Flavobacteriales bacterium]